MGTPEELADIENQRDVNNFLYEAIKDIETGDIDLDGYATEEWVTEQIDAIDFPETDLDGYATETYVDDSIAAIEFPDGTDLSGYAKEDWVTEQIDAIPDADLTGYATETYVDETVENLATQIPSLDGIATEDYVDDAIGGIVHPTYDDSGIKSDLSDETAARIAGDNTLQTEITELALALDTLLVRKTHGQWKYVGFLGDVMARNPGEFALGSDDLSASNNIVQLNNTDLNGLTVGMGDISVGDYVELVDINNPDNYVLFVVAGEPSGQGLTEIPVTLKEKGNNFLVNATCEIRFFELNDQSIDLSELDDRYARKDHTHPEFAEIDAEIEQLKDDLVNILPPPPEPPPTADGDLEKAEAGELLFVTLKSEKQSNLFDRIPYMSSPTHLWAWPDDYWSANGSGGNREISEISHICFPSKNQYLNTVDNTQKYYAQDFSETLQPGDFVRYKYICNSVSTHPSAKMDVTFVLGEMERKFNTKGDDFFVFAVTEATTAKDTPTGVHGYGDNLSASGIPDHKFYVNTMAQDFEREYVTPEYLDERLEDERAITDEELGSLQYQVDFMSQEINHLIPLKDDGTWKAQGSSTTRGVVKFNSSAKYGPWDEGKPIEQIYFNNYGADLGDGEAPVHHQELFQGMKEGDKFECFISKDNYCLFEITRIVYQSGYTYFYVNPLKWAGEGYERDQLLTFEFFDSSGGLKRTINEEMAGHYLYGIAKIKDQINLHNIHEHPGKFLCLDADGLVMDNQFGNVKTIHFAPVDANGNRPPCEQTSSTKIKKKCWEITTRTIKDDVVVPSFQYFPKTWEKNFKVGQTYNQAAQNIPTIEFHPDDYLTYEYDLMNSDNQWWKWPV
jgi:hypothetical protein